MDPLLESWDQSGPLGVLVWDQEFHPHAVCDESELIRWVLLVGELAVPVQLDSC